MTTPLAQGLGSRRQPQLVAEPWWLATSVLRRVLEHEDPTPVASASYRLGDAVLQVASPDPAVLDPFAELYGDCALPPGAPPEPQVRCRISRGRHPTLVRVTFQHGAPPDPAGAALSLLRSTRVEPPYTVRDSPLPGWRLAGGPTVPVLAACAAGVLVDTRQVAPDFLVEYLVGITLGTQPALLPVHGASLSVGPAGVLLVGASHAGKTTTALHLASRGHGLLGDEVALIRLATGDLVPLRRTTNLRPGPHAPVFAGEGKGAGSGESSLGARWTGPRRIGQLFPGPPPHPTRLRAAFFLSGFADTAALAPFRPTLDDEAIFDWLTTLEIAYLAWGLTPERRALRLLALQQVLARVPCWRLKVGTPVETAAIIERTMEELRC